MTRKTPRRRPIVVVHRPQGTPLTSEQRAVVERCRSLPQLTDPLEVELTLSGAVADTVADEEFWAGLVAHAASLPSRRNRALLGAMAAVLTGRPREWAAAHTPVDVPLAVGGAWICDRSVDAGYLALLCGYAFSSAEHAMVFLIDELAGGTVRKAFVTRDVALARARLAEQGPFEPIGAEAAHWLLAKSYDRLDRRGEPAADPDVRRTRLLAARRIALAFG
ncbi:hypothetical protein [Actinosynnema sp. NPDC020468]|uniref:hypothetical protein n=1 Tax=Actinosynnema sp. NPDC020468 TaxID=3154488 RepID=UPI00340D3C51